MRRCLLTTLACMIIAPSVIAAEPTSLTLFVGGGIPGAGPNFYVSLTRDGVLKIRRTGLPMIEPGKPTETTTSIKLTRQRAKALLKSADAAGDFDEACRVVSDGTSAQIVLESSAGS